MTAQVRRNRRTSIELALALAAALLLLLVAPALSRAANPNSITVSAHELGTNTPLAKFTYIVNVDNAGDPSSPDPMKRPSMGTPSNSDLVAEGDQDHPTAQLPDGKYLISIRSPGHKMWGTYVDLPRDNGTTVDVGLRKGPFPLGKIRVFVFDDSHHTNGAPDAAESGLGGFHVTVEEQTNSLVSVDYNNNPLCGGDCVTASDGFVQIDNMGPATYFLYVTPPSTGCGPGGAGQWVQTSTFDGGFGVQAGIEEGSDGTGAPGEQVFEAPDRRTAYFFGFTCSVRDFQNPGTATISGQALNWVGFPPFDILTTDPTDPVSNAYVALSNAASNDTEYTGQADGAGNFSIPNVPAGDYIMSIWDEQLNYIIRFLPVTVSAGQTLDLGAVGVSRWFGWLGGYVYLDTNHNGVRDCTDPNDPTTCESPVPNTDMDQRWRDGSIKESTFTDTTGYYEYPSAEGGPLGKWIIGEQGFARFSAFPGPSVHNELDPSKVTPVPTDQGGGLLTNQLLTEGHHARVDWGKSTYPDGTPGQIVGITYYATTRNEFEAYKQAHEDYEPGIPNVTVRLEGLGPDKQPNTADDPILNEYVTDKWQQPTNCDMTDGQGQDLSTMLNPLIGSNCLEVPITGVETKDGAFDGGYAFADYCPNGYDQQAPDINNKPCWNAAHDGHQATDPLVAGTYITHAIMPSDLNDHRDCNPVNTTGFKRVSGPGGTGCLYRPVREEDVNVDLGNQFNTAIPPPPCTGDMHTIDQSTLTTRSPYSGVTPSPAKPLCDKRLVVLQNKQNANADFHLMANQDNGVEVAQPGRIIGLVSDDIYFDRDKQSIWYGEPRPVANIPIGIRDYNYRLITTTKTDTNGSYEALLPSTETFNCPIPQGPCPGMYLVVINDPGDLGNANTNYNPNYLTASLAWDVWPGKATQLDTPLDPISGTGCDLPVNTPELLQVSKPYVSAGGAAASRRITIQGDFFGTTPGTVSLTDPRGGGQSRTLGPAVSGSPSLTNGGLVSWSNQQIEIQVPASTGTGGSFPSGQKQLTIRTAGAGGMATNNGLTVHVLGSGYNPTPVTVPSPPTNTPTTPSHLIQNAIDAAPTGGLIVLSPGVYHENVIMHKRVTLQGLGPGGIIGIGAGELAQRQPDDPRFNVQGTSIDGRFYADQQVSADWASKIQSLGSLAGVDGTHPVLGGAGITVVAKSTGAFTPTTTGATATFSAARIDGIGITTSHGDGAGGIQLHAYSQYTQITNDVLESNSGFFVGGIGIGVPGTDSHDTNVSIRNSRVMGSGGLTKVGGIGIFRGSDRYTIADSIVCANFGIEYQTAGGVSHWGKSLNGTIRDNKIYYNDSVGSGGGIGISQEVPPQGSGPGTLGQSTGEVNVDRNLLQGNFSALDGGGLYVQNGQRDRIRVRNNLIVNNGAGHLGGAVKLEDTMNLTFINNTVANNVSTATSPISDDTPHSAGLASEANDPLFQASLPSGYPKFSKPAAFFNNIFWQNQAYTLSSFGPGATLVARGFIDLEVHGTASHSDGLAPRYSLLTANSGIRGDGVADTLPTALPPLNNNNIFGQDPLFVTPVLNELAVFGSRQDPQKPAVTITGADPPVGLPGNYHLQLASPAIDRGAGYYDYPTSFTPAPTYERIFAPCSTVLSPQPFGADIDNQSRPQLRSLTATPWDLGADEVPRLFPPFPVVPALPWSCGGTS